MNATTEPLTESEAEFDDLMDQVRAGSEEAAQILLDRYQSHVLRVVRRRLADQMRSKFDSIDFVQAVWVSFFGNLSVVSHMKSPEDLIRFLGRVASNKVVDECRRRLRNKKTNINRERAMDGPADEGRKDPIHSPGPTPSEVAMANEEWSRLMRGQPAQTRRILQLKFGGDNNHEIAAKLGVNERTVRRVIRRLKNQDQES